jgi:Zn-dependent M16 (insulinase) family peptidase
MGYVYHTWLYDGDPMGGRNFPALIAAVRKEWEANPRLFEGLIQTWLLENPHRLLSILSPNPSFVEEQEARFQEDMAQMGQGLTPDDKAKIDRDAAALKSFQTEGDAPEAIASLPRLRIADMERQAETIPTILTAMGGVPALSHDLFTNGIAYLDLVFDLSQVPEDLHPYVPLLAKFMTNLGAAGLDYEAMAKRLALKTGGVSCSPAAGLTAQGAVPWQKLTFHVKTLYRNIPEALALLGDILVSGDLTDLKRQTDLLAEKKNALQAAVVPSGHLFARRLAAASLSLPAWRNEQWHGKTQLQFLDGLSSRFKAGGTGTQETLQRIKDAVLHRGGLLVNLTADGPDLARLEAETAALIARLPARGEATPAAATPSTGANPVSAIPAQVSYVAGPSAPPSMATGQPPRPPLLVLTKYLSNGYLYKTHSGSGRGPTAAMSLYDPPMAFFALSFLSGYPPILEPLKALTTMPWTNGLWRGMAANEEVEKAVIATIGQPRPPALTPAGRGAPVALARHIAGSTTPYRQVPP